MSVQRMRFRSWLIVASSLAFALGAARSAYAAPPADPCSLLSPARITAALGTAVGDGKSADPRDCVWSQPGTGLRATNVLLEILGPMGNQTPVDRFNTVKAPLPIKGVTKTPASGIGDDAVYVRTGALGTALYVKKGSFVFRLQVNGLAAEETKAKEKALAEDVLAKL